jgi:hypothetical protein
MASQRAVNVYGIFLTDEERKEWNKREKTTYLEVEIPKKMEKRLSKMIELEIKKYHKNKK